MNRRLFLERLTTGLLATAATAVLDPEELLWTPGRKSFVFLGDDVATVPRHDDAADARIFLTPAWITVEAIRMFDNNLKLTRLLNREYDEAFAMKDTATVTIRVPKPWLA
jgi:hypothetical protein